MPQLYCHVPDELAAKLQLKAEMSHMSVSKYLASLIRRDVEDRRPDDFFDLAGAWHGEPLSREAPGADVVRDELE